MEEYMDKLMVGDRAPDFALAGADGEMISLSEVYTRQNMILVFNIGFA
jgi:peroxiredoxin